MTEPLSPAAQAILAAWCDAHGWENEDIPPAVFHGLAAALRALADAVVPLYTCGTTATRAQTRLGIRHKILSIATELENTDD